MDFNLNHAFSILERTPAVLKALLYNLPEAWTHQNEGGDSWSPFDVVGHFIHGEHTDWLPRTEIILSDKTPKNFIPFDRFAQEQNSQGKSMNDLLAEFERLRTERLTQLKALNITKAQLSLTGVHPEFGAVTLAELLAAWVVHDLGHIAQVNRIMAKQYTKAVGPWTKYMGILKG